MRTHRNCTFTLALIAMFTMSLFASCDSSEIKFRADSDSSYGNPDYPYPCTSRTYTPEYYQCRDAVFAEVPQTLASEQYMLRVASSCEDAASLWRAAAQSRMERELALAECEALYPPECTTTTCNDYWGGYDTTVMDASSSMDMGSTPVPTEYTTTNVQDVGVDEADFIKNDGAHIYVLADNALQIVDAWPAAEASLISKTPIEGEPKRLFVHNGVAVVYSSLGTSYGAECTWGYDCEFTGDGNPLKITVFDLTDLAQPVLMREIEFDGSYLSSRRIENNVYSVVHFPEPTSPSYQSIPTELQQHMYRCSSDPIPYTDQDIIERFAALRAENTATIRQQSYDIWLPTVRDTRYVDGEALVDTESFSRCDNVHLTQSGDGLSLLSVASFDLTSSAPSQFTTVVSRPGAVYGSQQALYLAERHQRLSMNGWYSEIPEDEATTIHKFRLSELSPATHYVGSGIVKGRVLNQFAMSEHEGLLRVATTIGERWGASLQNTLTVLEEQGSRLVEVGQLDGIAPGEDIRSVRFDGDRAFIVTFRETDPLFAIDLSNPVDPTVLGELIIPGFSTYMHFMDRDHILSVGLENGEAMLQLFDVSDMSAPALMDKEALGVWGWHSEAATNHLAFNFMPSRNQLAVPALICDEYSLLDFNGLLVYEASVATGISPIGRLSHPLQSQTSYCWELEASDALVRRSIFMDEFVYSIAGDRIQIADIADLDNPVATVSLR